MDIIENIKKYSEIYAKISELEKTINRLESENPNPIPIISDERTERYSASDVIENLIQIIKKLDFSNQIEFKRVYKIWLREFGKQNKIREI
jgi:hypothetical protein